MPNLKVLLVEDNIDNQRLAKQIMAKAGLDVDIAANGQEAVAAARRYHYKIIFMDIQMPVMDGFESTELIRRLEAKRGEERTPIIALTANAMKGYRQKCLEKGMDDYITKPVNPKVLLETVDKWMDIRPAILIVDDIEDNRELISKHLLKETKYRVAFAANGIEAIAVFKRQMISLILMDMEMPVMDGYTAARIIRKLDGGQMIPIIAMTAHEGTEEIRKCKDAGCTDYVSKPMNGQRTPRSYPQISCLSGQRSG